MSDYKHVTVPVEGTDGKTRENGGAIVGHGSGGMIRLRAA